MSAPTLGCEDCGAMWARAKDVPVRCQPYTHPIEREGDEYVFTSEDDPDWSTT